MGEFCDCDIVLEMIDPLLQGYFGRIGVYQLTKYFIIASFCNCRLHHANLFGNGLPPIGYTRQFMCGCVRDKSTLTLLCVEN